MLAKALSSAILGIDAYIVEVEAHLTGAKLPKFRTVGLPEGGVDYAEDLDVIWHDYSHAIQHNQIFGTF
jgi:hypothetical protein